MDEQMNGGMDDEKLKALKEAYKGKTDGATKVYLDDEIEHFKVFLQMLHQAGTIELALGKRPVKEEVTEWTTP